ncbi:MAG: MFS transporter [Verrucomicrobia bacterium]|nr:MFS transporter [Verrucomicrobiota bacterium]
MNPPVSTRPLRWWLCGLMFVATGLSFLDRQVLSVLAPVVTEQLSLSNLEYSHVNTAFLVSYAVMFLVGGRLMDLAGTRIGMALSVGLWSFASALHAAARNGFHLGACRFFLGVGEGGCFPGAAKGVAEWFSERERAVAIGIAIGGASLGAVVAPPFTVWLAAAVGWRGVFLATGVVGVAWVAAWWLFSRELTHASAATVGESASTTERRPPARQLSNSISCAPDRRPALRIPDGQAANHDDLETVRPQRPALTALLRRRDVWGLALIRFMVDPVFYFYMFWIPKYLHQERGASMEQIGQLSWIPFLALGISNVAGGWASDRLIRAGVTAFKARRLIMAAAALLTVASSLTGQVRSVGMALAMMALLMLAHGFWVTNYVTLISDRFPHNAVGTVMGISGAVGAVGGMLANTAIGAVVDRFSYGPVWLASGLMYPLAFGVLMMMVGSNHRSHGAGVG